MVASPRAVRSLAALAAAWSAAGAAADIVKAEYFASILFHYKLNHMPDFDQRREDCCRRSARMSWPAAPSTATKPAAPPGATT